MSLNSCRYLRGKPACGSQAYASFIRINYINGSKLQFAKLKEDMKLIEISKSE
jgi:hypothetical protein